MDQFSKLTFGLFAPVPRIFKGCGLGMRYAAIARLEETVVTRFGIEGGIEIDQVNRFVSDLVSQYVEVVPEVEAIGRHRGTVLCRGLGVAACCWANIAPPVSV